MTGSAFHKAMAQDAVQLMQGIGLTHLHCIPPGSSNRLRMQTSQHLICMGCSRGLPVRRGLHPDTLPVALCNAGSWEYITAAMAQLQSRQGHLVTLASRAETEADAAELAVVLDMNKFHAHVMRQEADMQ